MGIPLDGVGTMLFKFSVQGLKWRREWLLTPIFLPGGSHAWRSLAGYSPWGHKESDTIEQLTHTQGSVGLNRGFFISTSSLSLPQRVEPGEMLHLTDPEARGGQVKGTRIPTPREAGREGISSWLNDPAGNTHSLTHSFNTPLLRDSFKNSIYLTILFYFGCTRSLLLRAGFLWLRRAGAAL